MIQMHAREQKRKLIIVFYIKNRARFHTVLGFCTTKIHGEQQQAIPEASPVYYACGEEIWQYPQAKSKQRYVPNYLVDYPSPSFQIHARLRFHK